MECTYSNGYRSVAPKSEQRWPWYEIEMAFLDSTCCAAIARPAGGGWWVRFRIARNTTRIVTHLLSADGRGSQKRHLIKPKRRTELHAGFGRGYRDTGCSDDRSPFPGNDVVRSGDPARNRFADPADIDAGC